MTKRDQVLRAWIEREATRLPWQSCISHAGKLHRKSTHTRLRKAALQFCHLHLAEVLFPTTTENHPQPHQTELFTP